MLGRQRHFPPQQVLVGAAIMVASEQAADTRNLQPRRRRDLLQRDEFLRPFLDQGLAAQKPLPRRIFPAQTVADVLLHLEQQQFQPRGAQRPRQPPGRYPWINLNNRATRVHRQHVTCPGATPPAPAPHRRPGKAQNISIGRRNVDLATSPGREDRARCQQMLHAVELTSLRLRHIFSPSASRFTVVRIAARPPKAALLPGAWAPGSECAPVTCCGQQRPCCRLYPCLSQTIHSDCAVPVHNHRSNPATPILSSNLIHLL
jgi:hypothetical protein